MAKISFTKGSFSGHELNVPEAAGISIGRSNTCDLTIPDNLISNEHASLRFEKGRWWIYDLNSSNGTLVNDQQIQGSRLNEGDRITIGETVFEFHSEGVVDEKSKGGMSPAKKKSVEESILEETQTKLPKSKKKKKNGFHVSSKDDDLQVIKDFNEAYKRMTNQLSHVIVGQKEVIDQVLIAIFCRGHALLIGVPGLAKTLLISTLSHVLDLSFKRIQFTPDLMPSDITGTDVLEEDRTTGKRIFRFVYGPIFANMILADEINRTPPKTQAALLEAMQEHRMTAGNKTYHLPEPFFVLATQNPIEQEGTYPLPEAQLDRFMFNIIVNYPDADEERNIIKQVTSTYKADLEVTLDVEDVLRLQQIVLRIPVADHVIEYARDIARSTRPKEKDAPDFIKEMVTWGAGPRAGIYMITAAKAHAILHGRHHATTEDVRKVALPVLRHRIITTFNAEASGVTSDDIVAMVLDYINPVEEVPI